MNDNLSALAALVVVDHEVDSGSGAPGVRSENPNEEHALPASVRVRVEEESGADAAE
jgi:hypothetical protein